MDEMNPLEPTTPQPEPGTESENVQAPPPNPEGSLGSALTPEEKLTAATERLMAAAGSNYDKSQMDALKAKLAKLGKTDEKTASGSEAPDAAAPAGQDTRVLTGRDVDWSEYNLDYNVAHLYKRAVFRDTPQGPKWVAMVTDFLSTTRDFRNYDKRVNAPGSTDKSETEPLNLGMYLNDMVNGREEWKIAAVMPIGSQCGLLLERQVPIILPDPQPLKKSEEVAPPSDPALQAVEDAALAFVAEQNGEQNGVDNGAPVSDHTTAPEVVDIGLRPIEKGTVEHEAALAQVDESTGAVEARTGAVVQHALEVAAPLTTQAPTAGVIQPEAVENPILGGAKVPAAGYSAAQDLLRALSDPKFRAQLPTEE